MRRSLIFSVTTFLAAWVLSAAAAIQGRGNNGPANSPEDGGSKWEELGNVRWAFVQGGKFKMGSDDQRENQKPAHMVTLKSFYMSVTEVTSEQYDLFCDSTGRKMAGDDKWGRGNRPVINVGWFDAVAYCRWLSVQTGDSVRLPSEAEYEYAARGGSMSGRYEYSGSDDIDEVAWYIDDSGLRTHEAGTKGRNELGLYDMSGNVWEWCADCYHPNYEGAPTDGCVWADPDSITQPRVVRGGSWYDFAEDCSVTARDGLNPGNWNYVIGFRIVRDAK